MVVAHDTLYVVGRPEANVVEVIETIQALGYHPVCVVLDDHPLPASMETIRLNDLPTDVPRDRVFLAAGIPDSSDLGLRFDEKVRRRSQRAFEMLASRGIYPLATLVHPTAHVSPSAELGANVFVGPLVTVASRTRVGDFSRIGRGSSIGHDVIVGRGVQVGPGVAIPGGVELRDGVVLGPGVVTLNDIIVGENALVGAGSVVTSHVPRGVQVFGNPARPLRSPIKRLRRLVRRTAKSVLRRLGLYLAAREWFRRRRAG